MKAILYYYSGTGNTELVAKLYQKYFDKYDVDIYRIKKMEEGETFPDPNDYDLVGIGFPIYGFNSPEPAFRFAQKLPKIEGEKKKAFIFKTSGEGLSVNNYAGQKIIGCMSKKGYDFMTERHIVMPYNMVFRHSPEMVKTEYIYADAMVRSNITELQNDVHEKVKVCPLRYWFVPIVRIVWPYAKFQGKFVMRVRKNKCIGCGLCAKACPMKNIEMKDKLPTFGHGDCCLCVACAFGCPKKAISLGILNGMYQNGSYQIEKTTKDPSLPFPFYEGKKLNPLMKLAYKNYYKKWDKKLAETGTKLNVPTEN